MTKHLGPVGEDQRGQAKAQSSSFNSVLDCPDRTQCPKEANRTGLFIQMGQLRGTQFFFVAHPQTPLVYGNWSYDLATIHSRSSPHSSGFSFSATHWSRQFLQFILKLLFSSPPRIPSSSCVTVSHLPKPTHEHTQPYMPNTPTCPID